MSMEGPVLLILCPATGFRLRDVVEQGSKSDIERPVLVCSVLHAAHKVPKDVIAMGLVLVYPNTTGEVMVNVA